MWGLTRHAGGAPGTDCTHPARQTGRGVMPLNNPSLYGITMPCAERKRTVTVSSGCRCRSPSLEVANAWSLPQRIGYIKLSPLASGSGRAWERQQTHSARAPSSPAGPRTTALHFHSHSCAHSHSQQECTPSWSRPGGICSSSPLGDIAAWRNRGCPGGKAFAPSVSQSSRRACEC